MRPDKKIKQAFLYSATAPDETQRARFIEFLEKKYDEDFELIWKEDDSCVNGFRLEVDQQVFDWTIKERLAQFREKMKEISMSQKPVIPLIRDQIENWVPNAVSQENGVVLTVGDGIATVGGLGSATYGEILLFSSGIRGMVQDLRRKEIGCIVFGDEREIEEGSRVQRTGMTAGVPVGDAFIGRVIDALGTPIDGKGDIDAEGYMPIESPAPGIVDRQPVNRPMETGLLAIDSMFPIGRGQRELIIGDRQTGKTAIAVDTILNQMGKDVICIYVSIGQKASSTAQLLTTLKKAGAMNYTIIVNASASDPVALQYIAPYAGCALGEYFMNKGKDVLIVYDDLSKHAVAYRALSLLLERSPGREAYPGDVFYLHSRLLERAAHLSNAKGGGSMTALPIVETQAGDVSAYIPTNIISITDGQIFLESDLFFAGQRPAVNVGLSVSRVGGDAQTKAMKKATGTLRLELAQYREMEVFTQFASDLDETTKKQLVYGQGLMRLLRQRQHNPMSQSHQVITLVVALSHLMTVVPIKKIGEYNEEMLKHFDRRHPEIKEEIERSAKLEDSLKKTILEIADRFIQRKMKRDAQDGK
ncbi:MAG: F0F1 ATP synthase subunit alpha [Eubacteriales bacterium]|nr:F0F1 ATP synthase subunit alpha [Eubacteriales bacterium]